MVHCCSSANCCPMQRSSARWKKLATLLRGPRSIHVLSPTTDENYSNINSLWWVVWPSSLGGGGFHWLHTKWLTEPTLLGWRKTALSRQPHIYWFRVGRSQVLKPVILFACWPLRVGWPRGMDAYFSIRLDPSLLMWIQAADERTRDSCVFISRWPFVVVPPQLWKTSRDRESPFERVC